MLARAVTRPSFFFFFAHLQDSGTPHLTGDMSAETYHRYIGIDAFVDSWMLGN